MRPAYWDAVTKQRMDKIYIEMKTRSAKVSKIICFSATNPSNGIYLQLNLQKKCKAISILHQKGTTKQNKSNGRKKRKKITQIPEKSKS